MGWFDIGGVGKAIWGAVTRPFTPPPPPPPPPAAPVFHRDAASIQSGGVDRLRQATLIDWRVPPLTAAKDLVHNNAGSLIGNNAGGLVSNNTASFSRPWWKIW